MKKIIILLTSFFLFFILGASLVEAALNCSVTSGSCGGTTIFKMQSTSNSHAELSNQANYSNYICCSGVAGLGNSCSGNYAVALKFSAATNAHVEENSYTDYANNVCLSASADDTVSCTYSSSCSGDYVCLASISGDTNAHVGDCNAYTTKVCCRAVSGVPACSCTSWNNVGCGIAPCAATLMKQTRSCAPAGCDVESQCVTDASCVAPSFNFSISVAPVSGSAAQGSSISATVGTTLISGATQSVSFSASGLPAGASASFNPTNCNPSCNSTMTINTGAATPVGPYSINICGTGGSQTRCVVYGLTVTAAGGAITSPDVTTNPATNVTRTSVTLNGTLNNMGGTGSCLVWFEWGPTTSYGNSTPAQTMNSTGAFSTNISGLDPDNNYYFRARAKNAGSW